MTYSKYQGSYSRRRYSNISSEQFTAEKPSEKMFKLNLTVNDPSLGGIFIFTVSSEFNTATNQLNDRNIGASDYPYGTVVAVQARPKNGARFVRWSDGSTTAKRNIKMLNNVELQAVFEAVPGSGLQKFTVTTSVKPEGSGTVTGGNVTVDKGDTVVLEATPKAGYKFLRWDGLTANAQSSRGSDELRITVDRNMHITAVFVAENSTSTTNDTPGNVIVNTTGGGTGGGIETGGGEETGAGTPGLEDTTRSTELLSLLKKYWWIAAIVVGYFIFEEEK